MSAGPYLGQVAKSVAEVIHAVWLATGTVPCAITLGEGVRAKIEAELETPRAAIPAEGHP